MSTTDHPTFVLVQPCLHHNLLIGLSPRNPPGSHRSAKKANDLLPDYQPGTETILLVEDEEALRHVITDSLEQLGYRVLAANSGDDALTICATYGEEIHLLLVDVLLPEMKGPELAQKILALRPQMKVIYVSGYPRPVLEPYGELEPGAILLQKPFSIKILSAKLRQALDG